MLNDKEYDQYSIGVVEESRWVGPLRQRSTDHPFSTLSRLANQSQHKGEPTRISLSNENVCLQSKDLDHGDFEKGGGGMFG